LYVIFDMPHTSNTNKNVKL